MQAAGPISFNTYVSAPTAGFGTLNGLSAQICLATNFIVLQTLTPTFIPGSSLNFTAFLGVTQSMTASIRFNVSCASSNTSMIQQLGSTPSSLSLDTPNVSIGSICVLTSVNFVNPYAAPANLTLTAAAQQQLVLSVPSTSVSTSDSIAYSVFASSDPSIAVPVEMNLYCNDVLIRSESVIGSASTQYFAVPSDTPLGTCQFNGTSLNTAFSNTTTVDVIILGPFTTSITTSAITTDTTSTAITTGITSTDITSTTTSVPTITPTLLLSASPATQTAGGFISYSVSFTPPSIQDAIIALECDPGTGQTVQTQTSSAAKSFQLNAFAMGACNLTASSTVYTSNTVYLTVQQQLYVSSSLDGWTGGSHVHLNITSPNLITALIPYAITCSTSSTSGTVPGSIDTEISLSSALNGVNCLLSTQSTAQYYLNLQPTFVNIAMSAGVIQSVITSIIRQPLLEQFLVQLVVPLVALAPAPVPTQAMTIAMKKD